VEFRLLGPLEVSDHGRALELGGRKRRALLALLGGRNLPTRKPPNQAGYWARDRRDRTQEVAGSSRALRRSFIQALGCRNTQMAWVSDGSFLGGRCVQVYVDGPLNSWPPNPPCGRDGRY
jgi:hypothetical protein